MMLPSKLLPLLVPPLFLPQVAVWEVNSHWQPTPVSSCHEDGGTVTHAVWLAASYSSSTPAAALCYAVSTPGSATVTLKCLDNTGAASVVQVSR